MADRKMQVERGNLAPYIVVNRDAAVAGVFSVDGERGSVNLEGKYAKISDVSSSNQEIEKLKPRVTAVESGLNETNITVKKIDDTLDKVEPASVIFNRDVLTKEIGVGYPRIGTSPSTRFGYHSTSATTPRLFMTNGNVGKTIQFPFDDGTIATREWSNKKVLSNGYSTVVKNPSGTDRLCLASNDAGEAGGYDYQNDRWSFMHNQRYMSIWGGVTNSSSGDYVGYKSQRGDGTSVQWQTSSYNNNTYGTTSLAFYEQDKPSGATNVNQWRFNREGSVDLASRQWIRSSSGISGQALAWNNADLLNVANGCGTFRQGGGTNDNYFSRWGAGIHINYIDTHGMRLFINGDNAEVIANVRYSSGEVKWNTLWGSQNTTVDGNGFIKSASPVVKLFRYGDFETNDESEGSKVKHIAKGVYKITGVLGFNSDGAWGGVDGGIEIPLDVNKQPKLWVDYSVESNGDILIKTYHREHLNSPPFAQNKIEGYKDGDPINIPSDTFISVRVQMPENSKWNIKQKEAEEFHKKELDNGKEILISDD